MKEKTVMQVGQAEAEKVKGTFTKAMREFLSSLGIDENVVKTALLFITYFFMLIFFHNQGDTGGIWPLIYVALILIGAWYYFRWSRLRDLVLSKVNKGIIALLLLACAFGCLLVYMTIQSYMNPWQGGEALWALVGMVILFAVSFMNNSLLTLSARYEREFALANEEKLRAERFKAELITNVSHDIQTPLTSIINYVDLLKNLSPKDKDFKDKFEEYIEVLDRKSARLKVLTTDLVEASKAATGNTAVNFQGVNLTELIWQVAGEFDEQFKEQNLGFVFNPGTVQFIVSSDSAHLWRILENLFGNAVKYSLAGTRVFAELTTLSDGMVKLSLKNISNEPLDQCVGELSEQFIRGDAARHTEGSGLGLYIAKSLAELMGGSLSISVSGDQFEVVLLLKPSAVQQVSAPQLDGA